MSFLNINQLTNHLTNHRPGRWCDWRLQLAWRWDGELLVQEEGKYLSGWGDCLGYSHLSSGVPNAATFMTDITNTATDLPGCLV